MHFSNKMDVADPACILSSNIQRINALLQLAIPMLTTAIAT